MVFLFVSLNFYINWIAVGPIKRINRFFRSVVKGEHGLDERYVIKKRDEIGDLADSFNQLIRYLRTSEEKYKRIFEGSKDAILVADCDGTIEEINPSGVELFGCKNKEKLIHERTFQDLFIESKDYELFIEKLSANGYIKEYETTLKRLDKKRIDVLIRRRHPLQT